MGHADFGCRSASPKGSPSFAYHGAIPQSLLSLSIFAHVEKASGDDSTGRKMILVRHPHKEMSWFTFRG